MRGVVCATAMFRNCKGINVSVGPIDAPKLKMAVQMFKDFKTLQRVANFKGDVDEAEEMFEGCYELKSLPMPFWILSKDSAGSNGMFSNTPLSVIYGNDGQRLAEMTRYFRQKAKPAPAAT